MSGSQNMQNMHRHRNSISQLDDFPQDRLRYCRTGSFALPNNNEDSLLTLLDSEPIRHSIDSSVPNVGLEHIPRHQISIKHSQITNMQNTTSMATPPPVPIRTPPVVPKRKYIPPQPVVKPQASFSDRQTIQQPKVSQPRRVSIATENCEEWLKISNLPSMLHKQASTLQYPAIPPPNAQRTRQAVRNQMSIESSKQLQNSAVLRSETSRSYGSVLQKNPQYVTNKTPVASALNAVQNTAAKTSQMDRVNYDPNVTNIVCNSVNFPPRSKNKPIETTSDGVSQRKRLPPPPSEPPPSIPSKKVNDLTSKVAVSSATTEAAVRAISSAISKTFQHQHQQNIPQPLISTVQNKKTPNANTESAVRAITSAITKTFQHQNQPIPPPLISTVQNQKSPIVSTANTESAVRAITSAITKSFQHQNPNIPPPLMHVGTVQIQKSPSSNKVSIRQDSSISSDSFSQTSSPSYTTKTMETPLLPHHGNSRIICNGKISSGGNCKANNTVVAKNNAEAFDLQRDGKNGTAALTKSVSTPASLQTIVRFHNGSNMSLHHRIIRDMRRPSSHYVGRIRLRFRLAQVVVNVIALLAIGGGLAAYFKAYPTAVQIVSNNVTTMPVVAQLGTGSNPAPGVCLPVIVSFCQYHKVPYNFTVFPNYMGHFGQRDAQQELEVYDAVVDVRCYELAALFLCSVFVPKCGPAGQVVRPCRSLCFETKRRCGFFLDVFGLTLPEYLECSIFPESADPDICVGHSEVKEAQLRAQKPVCPNGFQCDVKRCIPKEWQCDGHVDCKDQSDELNCVQCAKGMIHCGAERCMAQEHMCDGNVDCPFAQDERNCLRLSERNGDEGRGQLEIFRPENQQWIPACATYWEQSSPNDICNMLGYSAANTSKVANPHYSNMSPPSKNQYSKYRMRPNKKTRKNLLKEFKSCHGQPYPTVDLICTDYICGKIRKSYAESSLRIIGGATSKPGDWPFLAALLGGPEEIFYCAGVLIADQWVLTASHCVGNHSDVTGWTIQLGVTRRYSHSYYGQKMKVRRVVPHPMYNLGVPHDNDVALFQLASPVTFHEHLLPVCLPPPNKELLPGTVCTVIGWGKKEDKEMSEYEPAVNEVEVPVLNRDLCNTWLENRDLNVTEGMICAGYKEGGKDACQGDSGGPLLCRFDTDVDRWFVGGIVSWGIKCAHPHLPGVYAYVPKYIPWIKQQMALYSD